MQIFLNKHAHRESPDAGAKPIIVNSTKPIFTREEIICTALRPKNKYESIFHRINRYLIPQIGGLDQDEGSVSGSLSGGLQMNSAGSSLPWFSPNFLGLNLTHSKPFL